MPCGFVDRIQIGLEGCHSEMKPYPLEPSPRASRHSVFPQKKCASLSPQRFESDCHREVPHSSSNFHHAARATHAIFRVPKPCSSCADSHQFACLPSNPMACAG